MSSFVRRAAFALAFLDYNVLGSGAIESDSQMLWVRNVRDRLVKLAPFLSYDGDPYPVVVDGRIKWVVDAYTSTSRYPYAQRIGNEVQLTRRQRPRPRRQLRPQQRQGGRRRLRRLGHVLRQRRRRPDHQGLAGRVRRPLHARSRRCRRELREHLRYPEDLFRVQTDVYSKYQLEPDRFFERQGAWSVAQAPSIDPPRTGRDRRRRRRARTRRRRRRTLASEAATSRFTPYYTMFRERRRHRRGLRHPATVRAVLERRPAHRAAGVHDGVERPRQLRAADRVRRARPAGRAAHGVQRHRLRADDRHDDHAADRRRQPGALRRPADRARRRRAAVGPAVLRRGDPGQRRHVRAPASPSTAS